MVGRRIEVEKSGIIVMDTVTFHVAPLKSNTYRAIYKILISIVQCIFQNT